MQKWEDVETGIYYDRMSAEETISRLNEAGYDVNDISLLMSDTTRKKAFLDSGHKAAEGALAGAVIGGSLSALVAALTATGSIAAIVGTGGVATPLVAGPLAAALAALGVGAGAGGILGALVGVGLSEEQARKYEEALKNGGIIIGVRPRSGDRERLKKILATEGVRSTSPIR